VVVIGVAARPWALIALVAAPLAIAPLRAVRTATGRDLIPVLGATGRLQLVTGLLCAVGIAVSG
jgi:1,4-dihydroxy-2-naphthoate polyprenyltransferase